MTLDELATNLTTALNLPAEKRVAEGSMVRRARQLVPVVKGDLRSTIQGTTTSRGIGLQAGSRRVHYAAWVEDYQRFLERAAVEGAEEMAARIAKQIADGVTG